MPVITEVLPEAELTTHIDATYSIPRNPCVRARVDETMKLPEHPHVEGLVIEVSGFKI